MKQLLDSIFGLFVMFAKMPKGSFTWNAFSIAQCIPMATHCKSYASFSGRKEVKIEREKSWYCCLAYMYCYYKCPHTFLSQEKERVSHSSRTYAMKRHLYCRAGIIVLDQSRSNIVLQSFVLRQIHSLFLIFQSLQKCEKVG